jgi:hypothetical protein
MKYTDPRTVCQIYRIESDLSVWEWSVIYEIVL